MNKFKIILNLINSNGKILALFLVALCCLSFQKVSAQVVPLPTPQKVIITPKPKPGTPTPTVVMPMPRPNPTPPRETKKVVVNEGYTAAEKLIVTESKVSISLCVLEGNVRINGWD